MQLLDARGIRTVGELVKLGRAGCMAIRGFGYTSLRSVREGLRRIGLRLADDA
jgi:DNA-directed RNA polymerase alpha subunit